MACYLGLDASGKSTPLCAVDEAGTIIWRGVRATDPETLAIRNSGTQYLIQCVKLVPTSDMP